MDANRVLLYRGAIDNYKFPKDPEHMAYLEPAIGEFLSGKADHAAGDVELRLRHSVGLLQSAQGLHKGSMSKDYGSLSAFPVGAARSRSDDGAVRHEERAVDYRQAHRSR